MLAPSLFLNHGGGPNPVLGEKHNIQIADSLKSARELLSLECLKAIIIVTAHWEESVVTISSDKHHHLYFDYNNFPPESYKFQYNASGSPELAERIHAALKKEGIRSKLDAERGWDHGTFIPMMLINPAADIPIVQVSVLANQDAEEHYKLGEVLKQFREENIAVIGSGMSYHNMAEFLKYLIVSDNTIVNEVFDKFLDEACVSGGEDRKERLLHWAEQEGALEAHPPREAEHFMPLIVNAGAGGSGAGEKVSSGVFLGKFKLSGYIWRDL